MKNKKRNAMRKIIILSFIILDEAMHGPSWPTADTSVNVKNIGGQFHSLMSFLVRLRTQPGQLQMGIDPFFF